MRPGLRNISSLLAFCFFLSAPAGKAAEADTEKFQAAIKKGTDYLIQLYKPGANFPGEQSVLGYACLAGMTLLESGVDEKNPSLQNIIKVVRAGCLMTDRTYYVSLCLMFLDRLGDPQDEPFIQFLGAQLLASQSVTGGWGYAGGVQLTQIDEARVRASFKNPGRRGGDSDRPDLPDDPPKPKKEAQREDGTNNGGALHPEVGKLINRIQTPRFVGVEETAQARTDNSNTQFAVLALWCARKHGVPIEKAMVLVDKRFHASQMANGGWPYDSVRNATGIGAVPEASGPMTCAGLIALAVSYGASNTEKSGNLNDDVAVQAGFKYVGRILFQHKEAMYTAPTPASVPNALDLRRNLYFLWTLERVGVIYGVDKIGDVDWYVWGADTLVKTQLADGSWKSNFASSAPEVNTSLALLFLHRANVAKDLTAKLSGKGETALKSGSIGKKDPPKTPATTNDPPAKVTPATPSGSDFEKQAAGLVDSVIKLSGTERTEMINTLRDAKGSVNTEALKICAAKLTGTAQTQVRDALAQRLTRMNAATLRDMLADENREVRLAAARACGSKNDKQYVTDLIGCLNDRDVSVIQAAHAALIILTGKNFGPDSNASDADRTRAIFAWRNWWKMQQN
jgi:hypothetical protein